MHTRLKKYVTGIIVLLSILPFSGCRKTMDDLNINPTQPEFSNPDFLFNYSVKKGMSTYNTNVSLHFWTLMNWDMYFATLGGVNAGQEYQLNNGKDEFWKEQYSDALINAKEVERLTKGDPNFVNKNAISRIWQVFLCQRLTDLWGAIPYSDALKGIEDLNYSPAYDTQEAIYKNLLAELKTASALMNPSKTVFPATADPIYKGSLNQWIAFANSLRLRIAVRLRYVNPQLAQQEISSLQGAPMISNNTETASFPYNKNETKNNLFEMFDRGEAGGRGYPSKFLIDKLKSTNDPRIQVFAIAYDTLNGVPQYNGVPNLVPTGSPIWNNYDPKGADVSTIGNWFRKADAPGILMTYAEVCFLQAEAALLGWWTGNAQQLYEAGIRANMESYTGSGITSSDIITYINTVPAVTLENIITQKWIAFTYQDGYEAYAEYRRTGYPVFTDYYNVPINQHNFPQRLTYPATEALLNSVNYQKAIDVQGPDAASTKLWWDKN